MGKIKLYKCYYARNVDLGLNDGTPGHEVLTIKWNKSKTKVLVKTITSLEGNTKEGEKRIFKNSKKDLIGDIYNGRIIVIPNKDLNTPKLSGVYTKGIWIKVDKLLSNKYNTKFPVRFKKIIGK